ncbi:anti-repressor SinI family protein [Paenibacillus aurantius]|uniref:Anti-repressor SinI family protein n=1 Tax=Paenibacillus aurantius TaxID=2918900 RepID=A0AA96LH24_9BACL|nr:anti-repressor SinI family protein [Paenibacillus aurantius]WNQ11851.1 anti-repressor SinI family protein [Paenibacillus aurantius]
MNTQTEIEELDMEWVELIAAARQLGLSKEQVRGFLSTPLAYLVEGRERTTDTGLDPLTHAG